MLLVNSPCVQGKKVVVFYGSQTGTAEEFANRLAKDARRHGMPALAFDPEECTDWVRVSGSGSYTFACTTCTHLCTMCAEVASILLLYAPGS